MENDRENGGKRKRRSTIYNWMEIRPDPNELSCTLCGKIVIGANTTNAWDHLKRHHIEHIPSHDAETGDHITLAARAQQTRFKKALATWLAVDGRPHMLIEGKGFVKFMAEFLPQ